MAQSSSSKGGVLTFSLAGVPISVLPMFWLITWLIGSRRPTPELIEWVVVVFVSVVAHEMGHALAARALGRTVRIELHGMGGSAHHQGPDLSPAQRAWIAFAGPGAGFVLGGLIFALGILTKSIDFPMRERILEDALWVNWGYGVLNLLPILPLDGGNIMQQAVDHFTKRQNHPAGTIVSLVVAVSLMALSLAMGWTAGLFVLGWLAVHHATSGWAAMKDLRDRGLEPEYQKLREAYAARDAARLIDGGSALFARASGDRLKAQAVHMEAWGHFLNKNYREALDTLLKMPRSYQPDLWIAGISHLRLGEGGPAVEALGLLFEHEQTAQVAEAYVEALLVENRVNEAVKVATETHAALISDGTRQRIVEARKNVQ